VAATGLQGLRVISFESRRAVEIAELVRRHGGEPFVAPSMREVPIDPGPARQFLRRLEAGEVDVVILLTGVGTRALAKALEPECPGSRLAALLAGTTIVARGPKPVAVLREMGLQPALTVPEPNTWRELLQALDEGSLVQGKRVALQEYGVVNAELVAGLQAGAASLLRVPVYEWALPEDTAPMLTAIRRWQRGELDVVLFTSANQVHNVMHMAEELGAAPDLRRVAARVVLASIGPMCSEALRQWALPVDLEPEHPKMGHLLAAVSREARARLAAKQGGGSA
jgi:uroporphyrinogen-III synthase